MGASRPHEGTLDLHALGDQIITYVHQTNQYPVSITFTGDRIRAVT